MQQYHVLVLLFTNLLTLSVAEPNLLSLSHTRYIHPQEAVRIVQQVERAASSMSESDRRDINTLVDALDPRKVFDQAASWEGISALCGNQTVYMAESLARNATDEGWVWDMLDAWGKPGAGIRKGNLNWLGNFDECRGVQSSLTDNDTMVELQSFEGQYCTVGASLGSDTVAFGLKAGLSIGSCFPSGCSEADIRGLLAPLLEFANVSTKSVHVNCQEKELAYSNGAIVTIFLYCLMGAVCLAGTTYDAVLIMTAPPKSEEQLSNGHIDQGLLTNNTDTEILINPPRKKVEHKPSVLGELLMCFSLYTNGYKLLSTKQPPGSLTCLHGIRFISMSWVILGHTIVFSITSIGNLMTLFSWFKRFTFQVVLNATLSVDSFFVLSALLTSYLFLKELDRKKLSPTKFLISVPVMYLHRYIRLTPAYGFMILFYTCLSLYMYNSPLKPTHTTAADVNCVTNWWGALTYTGNVIDITKQCAGWGWYLSNDFQFFLVTPFVVYLMHLLPMVGLIVAAAMVMVSCVAAAGISVQDDLGIGIGSVRDPHNANPNAQGMYMDDYYFVPWTRYQSFGVGVIFGFLLWKCNGRLPFTRVINLCLWALSGCLMLLVLYGSFDVVSGERIASVAEAAIFNGWSRTAWSIGLGYVILACCLGRGGWVNEFLSWPGFIPLSRMTYCAYLVHPVIMTIMSAAHKNKVIWSEITYIYMFGGYMVLAYAVAFLFSLVFEAPFMLIDKKYLTGKLK